MVESLPPEAALILNPSSEQQTQEQEGEGGMSR